MKRLSKILLLVAILLCAFSLTASAAHTYGTNLTGSNINAQDYNYQSWSGNWSGPIHSYLSTTDSGNLMTVSYTDEATEVYYYTPKYSLYKTVSLKNELPIFGGFYETENNYYILSGQTNLGEDPNVEVYRVTKYDKNWQRISSVGLYDCNTTKPFNAGSARFTHVGDTLVIRTCHEMYQSSDGLNHQANLTFSINTTDMSIIRSWYSVANVNWGGYVSHSFNQFIKYDGEQLVAVDHGDAHPRSICLIKYGPQAFLTNNISVNSVYDLVDIPGEIGDNYTGVAVGGFEFSPSTYIVVGNSELNATNENGTRNIFVSTLSRDDNNIKLTYLTNYTDYDSSASTPHLVKISNEKFMVLWTVNDKVYYVLLNSKGEKSGTIRTMTGSLSDCVPIVVGEKVIWYTYNNNDVTFYSISTKDLTSTSKTTVNNGHNYVQKSNGTHHWQECSDCKKVIHKVKHSNTSNNTYEGFNKNGDWVVACKECHWAFKTEKVTYKLNYKLTSNNEEFTPVLTTPSKTLKNNVDYNYFESYWSYVYHNGGYKTVHVTLCFYGTDNKSERFYKEFTSLPMCADVDDIDSQAYTGKAISPKVNVVVNNKKLKNGTDYTVTYKNNTKIGKATVTITGKGDYFGTITKTFRIKQNIASATVSGIKSKTYTGEKITQSIKVVYNNKTLKKGTDYTISYKNNVSVGTATIKIIGKGSYAGTITKTFKIKAASISKCKIELSNTSYTYNGKVKTPKVTVTDSNGNVLKKNTDYTVSYSSGRKKVGTYKVTIKMIGNYSGTKTLTFKINPAKTSISKLTPGNKKITVNVTKQTTQVTGYEIQYSTSKKFTKAKSKTISKSKTTKCTLKGLKAKKTYYIRVRTYKTVNGKKYYSGWSKIKYVKTK